MSVDMFGALTPDAVTPIDDDGEALRAASRKLLGYLDQLRAEVQSASRAWVDLPSVLYADQVTPALEPLMDPALTYTNRLRDAAEDFLRIANSAVDDIAHLKREHDRLVADIEQFHASAPGVMAAHAAHQAALGNLLGAVATVAMSWKDVPQLVGEEVGLRWRLNSYEETLRSTMSRIAGRIQAVDVRNVRLPDIGSARSSVQLLGEGLAPAAVAALAGSSIPSLFACMTEKQIVTALNRNPALVSWIKGLSTSEANAWWSGLSAAQRRGVIAGASSVIGNLAGIPYNNRSAANKATLDQTMRVLKLEGLKDSTEYKSLAAVKDALEQSKGQKVPYQLLSLTVGSVPLAAISVGNADTARYVNWLVPGMNTSVEGDIVKDTAAARNLLNQQELISGTKGDTANIAWIGYHPPVSAKPWGEATDKIALQGGKNLAASINDLDAYRALTAQPKPSTGIVAHSYGTLVSSTALRHAHVDNAVFEGSPGIPTSVAKTATDLNVPTGHLFATQANHDGWAPFGQDTALEPRIDPTSPAFGAHVFSSEGGNGFLPVDAHGPLKWEPGNPDVNSYWDKGTQSIYDAAKVTLGKGDNTTYAGTPEDRLNALAQTLPPKPLGVR